MSDILKVRKGGITLKSVVQIGRKGVVTLPAGLRRQLHVNEGDFLAIYATKDHLTLVPQALIDRDQAWFWTPEWQAGETEATEDIRAGRTKRFRSVKELMKDLRA